MMTSPDYWTDGDRSEEHLDAYLPSGRRPRRQEPAAPEARPVDQIAIRKLGGFNYVTPAQWSSLSRDERLKLIKKDAVTFLYQGETVPLQSALLYLRGSASPQAQPTEQPRLAAEPAPPRPEPAGHDHVISDDTLPAPFRFAPPEHPRPHDA